ncbi:MAG: DUF4755 domain-containing protein [Brachymonas sp.]|nr:DUF4755 domain-containing protein [Brachymonas sp.]
MSEIAGIAIIFYCIYWIISRIIRKINSTKNKMDSEQLFFRASKNCKYRIFNDQTGLAVNPAEEKIILINGKLIKEYHFNDIREWRSMFQSGGFSIGPGVGSAFYNKGQIENNKANTGISFRVKDIDHAEWFVRFPYEGDIKANLAKWNEILNQYVRERVPE